MKAFILIGFLKILFTSFLFFHCEIIPSVVALVIHVPIRKCLVTFWKATRRRWDADPGSLWSRISIVPLCLVRVCVCVNRRMKRVEWSSVAAYECVRSSGIRWSWAYELIQLEHMVVFWEGGGGLRIIPFEHKHRSSTIFSLGWFLLSLCYYLWWIVEL